jgi:hypothetical protein
VEEKQRVTLSDEQTGARILFYFFLKKVFGRHGKDSLLQTIYISHLIKGSYIYHVDFG